MGTDQVGNKEKIQILLNEYNSLRNEINARISNLIQVLAIAAGAVALCLQLKWDGHTLILALSTISVMSVILVWSICHNFYNAGLRVQELEADIQERAGEKLLIWERERGGLAISNGLLNFFVIFFRLTRNG